MYCGNDDLESITIPCSVNYIAEDAFSGINARAIYTSCLNSKYYDMDGVLYGENMKLICMPAGRTGAYDIPYGCSSIGKSAFDSSRLSAVYIPSSVVKLEWGAFYQPKIDSLIVESEYPVECDWGALYYFYQAEYIDGQGWVYHEPSIFVPQGSLELYQTAFGWNCRTNYYEMSWDEMYNWRVDMKDVKIPSKQYTSVYYDLRGHKRSHPYKGINIIDGKKIFVK